MFEAQNFPRHVVLNSESIDRIYKRIHGRDEETG